MYTYDGRDTYARKCIENIASAHSRQTASASVSRVSAAGKNAQLEGRVNVLERMVVALLAVLERGETVNQSELADVLENMEILDENGDGVIDSADLVDKYKMDNSAAEKKIKELERLKKWREVDLVGPGADKQYRQTAPTSFNYSTTPCR